MVRRRAAGTPLVPAVALLVLLGASCGAGVLAARQAGTAAPAGGPSAQEGGAGPVRGPAAASGGEAGDEAAGGDAVGRLPRGIEGLAGSGWTSVSAQAGDVEQVAADVLRTYRDDGDCVLASSGYLDLLGRVWCCVVCGDGWADVCVVDEEGDEGACAVRVLRLEADEVAGLLDPNDELGGGTDEGGGS